MKMILNLQTTLVWTVLLVDSASHAFVVSPKSFFGGIRQQAVGRGCSSSSYRGTACGLFNDKNSNKELEKPFAWSSPGDKQESSPTSSGQLSIILAQAQDVLEPASKALDDATGGWALGYADLSPETEKTPVGQAFLASNIAYALAGLSLSIQGDTFLGLLTEVCSIASFIYHYTQLQASSPEDSNVRLALLVDYIFACTSILVGMIYILMDQQLPPIDGLVSGGVAIACLLACWVWERGMPYIVLHSLWHLFSAYCGFVIGNSHLAA